MHTCLKISLACCLLVASFIRADESAPSIEKRVYAHLLIQDPQGAVQEAKRGLTLFPESKELHLAYIRALSENGNETAVLQEWEKTLSLFHEEISNRTALEVLAWGVLNKAERSPQLMIQFNSLLGAAFTHDIKALPHLIRAMRGTNTLMRMMAVKLSASYGDAPLQEELERMLKEEKVWAVKLEVIRAIGALRMTSVRDRLKDIISHDQTLVEEKAAAILAIVSMYDAIGPKELNSLLKSNRAGLRQLGCQLVAHLDMQGYAQEMKRLLSDSCPDVRIEALYTLGLLREKIEMHDIEKCLQDSSPVVSITAGWLALLNDVPQGEAILQKWMHDPHGDLRGLSAAALTMTGKKGVALSLKELEVHTDPYVRATLAIGLIGQRKEVKKACDALYDVFCDEQHTLWMWQEGSPFRFLSRSDVPHTHQIPNYPHVIDRLAKLEILHILNIMRTKYAEDAMRIFLKNDSWRTIGVAAGMLLQEGNQESLDLVRGLLEDEDEFVRVQAAIILALGGGDPRAVKVLQEAYPQVDREMKIHILEAIGRVGNKDSIPFLIEILKEPFQMLRVVAASALIQCIYH